ncbi:MAG: hypothetical protein PHQ64_04180 [Bacilli bacterium]|nr:hypothetical protein [Bacilli bacterium]
MKKRYIEKSLKKSINYMTEELQNPIKNKEMNNIKFKYMKLSMAVIVSLVITTVIGINFYDKNYVEYAKVSFDVNPSITLSANSQNKVIKEIALNDDGNKILEDIDVIGLDIEEASKIIVDKLIKEGYLDSNGSNILLTVENNDLKLASETQEKLISNLNVQLEENYIAGTVISQIDTVKKNIPEEIKSIMEEYKISYSKSIFISNILKKNIELKIEDLANLKISEISKLINDSKIDISDIAKYQKQEDLYKSKELMDAKKEKDNANNAKNKAEVNLEKAKDELVNDLNKQEELEKALEAKEEAEQKALEAQEKYQELENEQNNTTTENKEQNQNTNVSEEQAKNGLENSNIPEDKGR